MKALSACLTPYFLQAVRREGWAHSHFERVVNLAFPEQAGPPRLLTLTRADIPELPDSMRLEEAAFRCVQALERGAPVVWTGRTLLLPGLTLEIPQEAECPLWRGARLNRARAERFLRLYEKIPGENGIETLPEKFRCQALLELENFAEIIQTGQKISKNLPVGLGKGTTPAGDDALVGVLSAYGKQKAAVFPAALLEQTTDVSARYLRCAQEGYFSAPVRQAWERLDEAALAALAQVGATSGRDMLLGMALACRHYLNKEEIRMHVKDEILSRKLIAIVRGLPSEQLEGLAQAFCAGGIGLMEITFNQQKPETWAQTAAGIRMLKEKFAGKIIPGAGTVITLEQLQMAYDAGAQYIISPNVDVEIIRRTKELGLISLPGAMTPSEIVEAYKAGADFVKVFPVGNLGPAYIKALKAPLSHIPLMAVGGVNEKNAADFLKAGASGLGVGGNLVNKEWIANGEWEKITALAAEFVKAVQE